MPNSRVSGSSKRRRYHVRCLTHLLIASWTTKTATPAAPTRWTNLLGKLIYITVKLCDILAQEGGSKRIRRLYRHRKTLMCARPDPLRRENDRARASRKLFLVNIRIKFILNVELWKCNCGIQLTWDFLVNVLGWERLEVHVRERDARRSEPRVEIFRLFFKRTWREHIKYDRNQMPRSLVPISQN